MKKELIFAAFLISLFALTIVNTNMLGKMTNELTEILDDSLKYAENGDWDTAVSKAEEAESLWNKADPYTHIVVRHSEIDITNDAFYDYLTALYSREDGEAKGTYKALLSHISSIVNMEKVTFGSIF